MRIRYALPLLLFTASLAANAQGQFVIKGTMLSDSLCYSKGTVRKVYGFNHDLVLHSLSVLRC